MQRDKQLEKRQEDESPRTNKASNDDSQKNSSNNAMKPEELKGLTQNLSKLNKLGPFTFYLRVTPLHSYTSKRRCDK